MFEVPGDHFNDGCRVVALTIDIREYQDWLIKASTYPARSTTRNLHLLYMQRRYVLDRLRVNNFPLYHKTLLVCNLEHHGHPILHRVARVALTERIIDMKLRTMNQIDINIKEMVTLTSFLPFTVSFRENSNW